MLEVMVEPICIILINMRVRRAANCIANKLSCIMGSWQLFSFVVGLFRGFMVPMFLFRMKRVLFLKIPLNRIDIDFFYLVMLFVSFLKKLILDPFSFLRPWFLRDIFRAFERHTVLFRQNTFIWHLRQTWLILSFKYFWIFHSIWDRLKVFLIQEFSFNYDSQFVHQWEMRSLFSRIQDARNSQPDFWIVLGTIFFMMWKKKALFNLFQTFSNWIFRVRIFFFES